MSLVLDKAVVYTYHTSRLGQWMNKMTTVFPRVTCAGIAPHWLSHQQPSSCSCFNIYVESLLVLPPSVSLGVLYLQEIHITNYNEHISMNKLHTAMQPACCRKCRYKSPQQNPDAALPFCLPATLEVGTNILGTQTTNSLLTDQHL